MAPVPSMGETRRDHEIIETGVTRVHGYVSKRVDGKAFLFITGEDGREYFAHRSAMTSQTFDTLDVDDAVTFLPQTVAKGFRAIDVQRG